jgi:hypothetical protein
MPNEFIRQRIHDVNIEKYPQSFEPHQGSMTVAENKILTQETKKKLHDDFPIEQGEIDTEREGQKQHL